MRGRHEQVATEDETARDLHPAMTRPFSKNRIKPASEAVAVMVMLWPLEGDPEKVSEIVGVPSPTVIVTDCVAVAPVSSVAVMMQFPVAVGLRVLEEIVQGPETLVKVIDPDPEPPEVVSERSLPKLVVIAANDESILGRENAKSNTKKEVSRENFRKDCKDYPPRLAFYVYLEFWCKYYP